jgi:hypothetical protein
MTLAHLQAKYMLAAAAYRRIWREIEIEIEGLRPLLVAEHRPFFLMRYTTTRSALNGNQRQDGAEVTVEMQAEFKYMMTLDSFSIRLVEIDLATTNETLLLRQEIAIEETETQQ